MLKAINTEFDGYRFRSRLEARWAMFFKTLGIPYEYEKEGYDLDGLWYLPDFWLPEQQCWVEIKGQEPTEEEKRKAELLAYYGNSPVGIFWQGLQVPERDARWHGHYQYDVPYYKKSYATFYAPHPRPPFPFQDHLPLYKRSVEEKEIIDEWNAKVEFIVDEVPLSIANFLKPYVHNVGIVLEEWGQECCASRQKRSIRLKLDDEGDLEEDQDTIIVKMEGNEGLLDFLAIRPGWTCYFNDGCYSVVGWSECPACGRLSFSFAGACHCTNERPYPVVQFDSPRLIAAYTAARQARFEHGGA